MIHHSSSDLAGMTREAWISECELYRYKLIWRWTHARGSAAPLLYALLLNPSTASHEKSDPTLDGLIARARRWGFGGVCLGNLFALRATDPRLMLASKIDPVGPLNDRVLRDIFRQAFDEGSPIICGWGKHGAHRGRDAVVRAMAERMGIRLMRLELNGDGSPRHPLYIAHDVRPTIWES